MGNKSYQMVKRPKCQFCTHEAESWHSLPQFMGQPYCPSCKEKLCDSSSFENKLKREKRNGIDLGFGKRIDLKDIDGIGYREKKVVKEKVKISAKQITIFYEEE